MPFLPDAREDVVLAGKSYLGGAVADVDLVIGRLKQAFADIGGKTLPQHDGVALAVLESVDAELGILDGNSGIGRARNGDIRARNRPCRAPTDAVNGSRRAARQRPEIHLVVGDLEAVLLPQRLVHAANGRRCRPRRGSRDRRRARAATSPCGQRPRPGTTSAAASSGLASRPQIGGIGCDGGPFLKPPPLGSKSVVRRPVRRAPSRARPTKPWRPGDGRGEKRKRAAGVSGERRVGIPAQLLGLPVDRAREARGAQLFLQAHAVARKVVAHEGFCLRQSGRATSDRQHRSKREGPGPGSRHDKSGQEGSGPGLERAQHDILRRWREPSTARTARNVSVRISTTIRH